MENAYLCDAFATENGANVVRIGKTTKHFNKNFWFQMKKVRYMRHGKYLSHTESTENTERFFNHEWNDFFRQRIRRIRRMSFQQRIKRIKRNFSPCGEKKYDTKHLWCDEWHEPLVRRSQWDFPTEVRLSVGIREIRCRLRLREIYLCSHGHEYSSHSWNSLLKKTVWNFRNLSYSKKIRFIRAIRCLDRKSVV